VKKLNISMPVLYADCSQQKFWYLLFGRYVCACIREKINKREPQALILVFETIIIPIPNGKGLFVLVGTRVPIGYRWYEAGHCGVPICSACINTQ